MRGYCVVPPQDVHQADCRRAAVGHNPASRGVPELAKALEQVDGEKFPKRMAYLPNPVSRRVRTDNHVERTNRMFRFPEEARYKWGRRKTLVRFEVLTRETIGRGSTPAEETRADHSKPGRCQKTPARDGQRTRRVA